MALMINGRAMHILDLARNGTQGVFLMCDFSILFALKGSNEKQYSLARSTLNS
jgi:hypothetical protein